MDNTKFPRGQCFLPEVAKMNSHIPVVLKEILEHQE